MILPRLALALALVLSACESADAPPPPGPPLPLAETPVPDPAEAVRIADSLKEAATRRAAGALPADPLAWGTRDLPSRGPDDAPVSVVAFVDFQCPFCRSHAGTLDALRERYPEAVRVVHTHFPLAMHDWAETAAVASACAGLQGEAAFWTLHDLYMAEGDDLAPATVLDASRAALAPTRADLPRWDACTTDPEAAEHVAATRQVEAQAKLGRSLGVTGTPGTFVNGVAIRGAQPLAVFVEAVEAALAERTAPGEGVPEE